MNKYIVSGLAAAALAFTVASASAYTPAEGEVQVDGSLCGFTAQQINNGFKCYSLVQTTDVSRLQGNDGKCKDGTITTSTITAVNRGGNVMDTRTEELNEESDPLSENWGGQPYPPVDGACNHDLVG